jgi:signal transduction histidine kinase
MILLLCLFGIVPAMIITGAFLASYEKQSLTQLGNDVRNQCQILATQIGNLDELTDEDKEVLKTELNQLSTLYDGRIIIVDENFQIAADTYGLEVGRTMVAEEVIKCFKGENMSHYVSGRFVEMTVPISSGEEDNKTIVGVILASASTDTIQTRLETLRTTSDIWLVVVAVIVLGLAVLLASWLVKPLRHMNQSISGWMDGMLDGDLDIHDCTETENISDTFNRMLAKLRLVEESRQEFVSNVSHELKTPLTSMKVLADSLLMQEDAPVELYKEFMQDIAHEIDRENSIISDLLTLVKMDRKSTEMNIASADINEFLEQVLKRLRPIAERASVEVVFESNRSVQAEIDETKLSLAFSNLVENAIKYNKENGWVKVTLDADHKYFYVKVEDSGIGIPQESLDSVFDRFYRVDKSHSREIGGTGLGLAITKRAVVAHRGAIKVQSTLGEGTTFTVRIPLKYIA